MLHELEQGGARTVRGAGLWGRPGKGMMILSALTEVCSAARLRTLTPC